MNLFYSGDDNWVSETLFDEGQHPVDEGTPQFQNIHFSHITARDVEFSAGFIKGLPEMPIKDVSFEDVSISMALDAQPGIPAMAPHIEVMQQAGFLVENVDGIRFRDAEVSRQKGPVLKLVNAANVEINAVATRTPCCDTAVIRADNIQNVLIHNCRANSGTGTFLEVHGKDTAQIFLENNNLAQAEESVVLTQDVQPDVVLIH